jgi:hypothetical protein
MPTVPNTHQSARAIAPDARVLYLDNDPVAVGRLRELAAGADPSLAAGADPSLAAGADPSLAAGADPSLAAGGATLDAVAGAIDLSAPVCLLLGFLLHFFAPGAARDLVAGYAAALAPGSYVVLSAGRGDSEAADSGFGAYSSAGITVYNHSVPEFTGFFGALELVPPGVVDARAWHPVADTELAPRDGQVVAGVARAGPAGADG